MLIPTMTISNNQIFQFLIEATPEFSQKWNDFLEEWKDEKKDLPYYIALNEFAIYLINKLEKGKTDDFKKIFDVIEKLHVQGDEYVKEAVTVGLLEDLQNKKFYINKSPSDFEPFLNTETKRWWYKLNEFWEKGKLLKD